MKKVDIKTFQIRVLRLVEWIPFEQVDGVMLEAEIGIFLPSGKISKQTVTATYPADKMSELELDKAYLMEDEAKNE